MTQDEMLTVQEVADFMKVSDRTVRNWVNAGELARISIGKKEYRIRRSDLEDFIHRRRQAGNPPVEESD
jgi:nitrogen PTS system EIIA component